MSVLTHDEIIQRLNEDWDKKLIITPLLDMTQIGPSSVDVRLGHEFVVSRSANLPCIDPLERQQFEKERSRLEDRISLGRGKPFYLHPGELVLGCTLEYMLLPRDLAAYVSTRSSWGRVGLVIATAISVAPGFRGVITFELTNLGYAPLKLLAGVRIAQMVFHRSDKTGNYEGRYPSPTGPAHG